MGKRGVEDMISELEIFIDNCKFSPLSSNKILVPKDEIGSMLNELRLKLPSEIDRSKKIMRNKEAMLTDARNRADAMMAEAREEANRLVSESQIVELANIQANEILRRANEQAAAIVKAAQNEENDLRLGAMLYTKSQLDNIKKYIASTLEAEKTNYEHLIASLENDSFVVNTNADEIDSQIRLMQGAPAKQENPVDEEPIMPGVTPQQREAQAVVAQALNEQAAQNTAAQDMSTTQPIDLEGMSGGIGMQTMGTSDVMQAQQMAAMGGAQAAGAVGPMGRAQAAGTVGSMGGTQAAGAVGSMDVQMDAKPRSMGTVVDGAAQEPLW